MQKTILAIIALTLFGLANAQVKSGGACPNVKAQSFFNLYAYMGTFYEYAKYPVAFEGKAKCVTLTHTGKSQIAMNVLRTIVDPSTNKTTTFTGIAKLISTNGTFQAVSKNASNYPLWNVLTDYTSYAIVYTCRPADGNSHNTNVWILTRARTPSPATVTKARNVLSSIGISLTPLTLTDQRNC